MSALAMPVTFTADEYAQLGSDLETADEAEQRAFGQAYAGDGDIVLSTLAAYARASAGAKHHRLAGRISVAAMWERVAEREYQRLPKACRW